LDGLKHLWGKLVRLWSLSWLSPKLLAASPCGGETGFHALAEKITFELGNTCQHGGHHPPMGCIELEGHAVHSHDRNFPACEPIEGIEQILCGSPPSGQLTDQDGVYLPSLREIEDLIAGSAIGGGPGGCFLEHTDDIIAAAFCKCGEFRYLSLTGLVGCRNSGVDGRALSQLNPLGFWPCKLLILLVQGLS